MLVFILVFGTLILANPVQAGWFGDAVAQLIGWIVYAFVYVIGLLIMLVMWVLIKIAQYNDFINAEPVTYGWTIVRDVCNMFFILILLIIAFATILRVERYSFKTLLPKLILMAILINFSKLICGVFIDFTQVIMLTFVNGFKDIGTGNLTNMLGIDKIMSIEGKSTEGTGEVSAWSIVGAYMLALMYSVIALITLVTMVAVLAMRMIMIWVYVVLSPMAYLLSSFPAGEKYASQWWEEFSKNLIIGPILAFFIWLSFVSLGGVETPKTVEAINGTGKSLAESGAVERMQATGDASSTPSAGITEAGSPDHMIKFIISIAMLVGGLQISQQLGGQAGGMAGKGMAKMQKMGSGAMKSVGTGLKRATGVERVQMAYKSYKDTKASERSSRAKDDALMASRAIGKAKETVIAKPYQAIKSGITQGASRRAEKEKLQVVAKTQELQELKVKIKPIDELSQGRERIERERESINTTGKDLAGNVVKDKIAALDSLDKREAGLEIQAKNEGLDYSKLGDKNYVDTMKTGILKGKSIEDREGEIEKHQAKADKYEKIQSKVDNFKETKLGKVIGAVPKVASAIFTPGHFAMEALRGKQGFTGGGLSTYGQKDIKRAANYNAQNISAKKDEMKYSGKDKIMDVIKNSNDHHEHAAATAIALEKGYFPDTKAAAEQKDKVHSRFGKDDRVTSVMNTAAEKNYIELSPPYSTLRNPNTTPAEKKSASDEIAAGLERGSTKIADMSTAAIDLAIGAINSMKDKSFQKQFDGTSDTQQKNIKVSLEREISRAEAAGDHDSSYKAKKKLAYTESFNINRFGPSSDLNDPTQKRNHEQKKEFLGSMNDSEVAKTVKSKTSRQQFLEEIKVHLDSSGVKINEQSTHEDIAAKLKSILPNAGLETMDSTSKAILNAVKNHVVGQNQATPPPSNPVV